MMRLLPALMQINNPNMQLESTPDSQEPTTPIGEGEHAFYNDVSAVLSPVSTCKAN